MFFYLKATELRHKIIANLILVMDHVVTYFVPTECLSKQKRYIRYKMDKPQKLTTRQYLGLVCNHNSRMAQMPPLFNNNQHLDESEIVDLLANKVPRTHKVMMILQGFNTETGYLATLVEHSEQAETTDNISMTKFPASDEDRDTMKNTKCSKNTKEREDSGKKRCKNSSLYCSLRGENTSRTSRECKFIKARASEKDKSKYFKKSTTRQYVGLVHDLNSRMAQIPPLLNKNQ